MANNKKKAEAKKAAPKKAAPKKAVVKKVKEAVEEQPEVNETVEEQPEVNETVEEQPEVNETAHDPDFDIAGFAIEMNNAFVNSTENLRIMKRQFNFPDEHYISKQVAENERLLSIIDKLNPAPQDEPGE